jgi:hypothetical protein
VAALPLDSLMLPPSLLSPPGRLHSASQYAVTYAHPSHSSAVVPWLQLFAILFGNFSNTFGNFIPDCLLPPGATRPPGFTMTNCERPCQPCVNCLGLRSVCGSQTQVNASPLA